MKKLLLLTALCGLMNMVVNAQRMTDKLDRGLVAVKVQNGVFCSWRIMGEEYYDVKYNLYRDGAMIAENLDVSNYTDVAGSTSSKYTVSAVVRGKEQSQSNAVSVLANSYLEIAPKHDESITSILVPNDACCADVDGDGQLEILLKYDNQSEINASYPREGNNGEYSIFECLKLDGTVLWWVNCGPNMGDFQNNEQNIVAYDWDLDGKAEAIMRAADGTTIHMADGTTYVVGDASKNYRAATGGGANWFMHDGDEFLVYMNGETGKPYQVMEYPLKRLEAGETNLERAWGDGYGHRSTKHFFGAPYLDGRKPSIFLARGIYTRHKMIAYDVNPATHELSVRWTWNCSDASSPWYGNGYHNYAIADVDWDGRDEICFGSMVIDDNGLGLSTTGLGHGDAQHHSDFDPYTHGHEIFACNEDAPSNNYRDATTSKIRYRMAGGDDDGRCMAGNFCNDYPGAMGFSAHDNPISCVTNDHINGLSKSGVTDNMRIYWDGDLCEENFNYVNGKNTAGGIYKYGKGLIATLSGSMTNNDTKGTPCYQGDVFGDWREEVIMRTANNHIRIYTTTTPTTWRNYTLWHDMQYRQAMVWQMCGYNQPPHVSYFLGELEGITQAPPALTMTDRTEIVNGGTITSVDQIVMTCETNDMEVVVSDACEPYVYIDNAPSWVQGTNSTSTIAPDIKYQYYTHTLTGGAFAGATRIVKQGDGTLVLPNNVHKHSGNTDVWAGTLQCDGTLDNSPLWLNRHTSLISNGGSFMGGITADYNATLYPGGQDHVGNITATTVKLGFGSRIVFDIDGGNADQLNAGSLTIEKKVWPNGGGPAYDTPVFQIKGNPAAGTYMLGTVQKIEGDIANVVVEGLTGKKATLSFEDMKLVLTIQDYVAKDLTWTGSADGRWNTDETANFTDAEGLGSVFVPGSTVTFDDNALKTNITVVGNVAPKSIVFNNETKTFTISGDSLVGEPTITKNGAGEVVINNVNHAGVTTINGGRLTVSLLANNSGTEYGSLGNVKKGIIIQNGGSLGVKATTTSDQPVRIGDGDGSILVVSGATLTQSGAISGSGKTLTKQGAGTLATPASFSVQKLVIQQGTVQATESGSAIKSLPATVEFQGGTLKDNVNIYSYSTNNANFVVPEGKTGSFYADSRCNYKGTLTGKGTFNVYATSVRGYFQGNWSNFEGTVTANTYSTDKYDDSFFFDNSYGLPKATLKINSGVTFDNNGKSMSIGSVTGTGALGGSGTYTIGGNNNNMTVSFTSSSPIVKVGEGVMIVNTPGNLKSTVTIKEGALHFDTGETTALFGGALTVEGTGAVVGSGLVSSITLKNGAQLTPRSLFLEDTFGGIFPGTIKTSAAVNFQQGSTLNIIIQGTTTDDYSRLTPRFLTMNGTVKVTLADGYTPKVGDTFTLWSASGTFSGTPVYDLPALPEGLFWNTSLLATKEGVLSITDDASAGIGQLAADAVVNCEVYTITGIRLGTFQTRRNAVPTQVKKVGVVAGTYIVKMTAGRNTQTETIVIR